MPKRLTIIQYFLYALPAVLFFSYYPVIHFGSSDSMNFEISLPIIWLVLFFFINIPTLISAFKKYRIKLIPFLLFPTFALVSLLWSSNRIRGFLTAGILWLVGFAIISIYHLLKTERAFKTRAFLRALLKTFFISSAIICLWCLVQSFLDALGVSRDITLMCEGCTYQSFGFPHPNGFAIEPQFMGNLLLAPSILSVYLYFTADLKKPNLMAALAFLYITTLFLTFSRGAIYSFAIAMAIFIIFLIRRIHKARPLLIIPLLLIPFAFSLVIQGCLAQISPSNDTFVTGITKSIHQLSLGTIDLREPAKPESTDDNESTFDGYVEESTKVRSVLSYAALNLWAKDLKTFFFGVGFGGAGVALHENYPDKFEAKEIVQNQYVSLALELGLVGIICLVVLAILIFRLIKNSANQLLFKCLIAGYAVSIFFFAGLPNALHIYLLTPLAATKK